MVLLTLLPFSLMLFPYVLIHWRRSLVQWIVVTSPLEGASTMLRSGLLGWVAAAGATPFVVVAMTEGADFASAFIGAAASVVVFLASTAWLGRRMKPPTEDIKLVLLRVFGSTGRTRFLFDIAANWRGLGSVVCISAPDVSTHQMERDVLVDVLFGMLRVRFALGEPHESESLARFGRPPPLRRVVEIPASADNWKQEMRYSLTQNAIVLMDLRGFTADKRGCEFELGVLVDKYLLDATVILIDTTTDVNAVEQTLTRRWMAMAGSSPDMRRESNHLELFMIETADDSALHAIVRRLCNAWLEACAYYRLRGGELLAEVIESLRALAADVDEQLARFPDDAPRCVHLEALTLDPDFDAPSYLLSWGLIDETQELSLAEVTEASLNINSDLETEEAMRNHPAWDKLRTKADAALATLNPAGREVCLTQPRGSGWKMSNS